MNRKRSIGLSAAGLLLAIGMPAQATVLFNFNYTDAGVGFNDPTEGAARQSALQSAGDYLAGFLVNYDANIFLNVDGAVADGSTLAAAGSEFNGPISEGFGNQGDVMRKILGGDAADPAPGAADGSVTWNFADFDWELGNDFQAGEFDFFSTAVHELIHALGFSSDIAQNGDDPVTGDPDGNWSPFDNYIADSTGDLIDDLTFLNDTTRWATASVGGAGCGNGGLQFNGPSGSAEIYSPNPWEDGSSGSHLDDQCYGGIYMMEAATDPGLGIRTISALEIGMLRDIGYTQFGAPLVGQVPAPPVIFLMAGGLVLLGFNRKKLNLNFKTPRVS